MKDISIHPTSVAASNDRLRDRENLARQLRTTQMMREQAREQIHPTELISELIEIDLEMQGDNDLADNQIPLEPVILAALRARADIKFRLLSKVLPDLKATESVSYSSHDHQHLHAHGSIESVSNMELAQRLQLWRSTHLKEIKITEMKDPTTTSKKPTTIDGKSRVDPTFDFL